MFEKSVLNFFRLSVEKYSDNNAFYIADKFHSYKQFSRQISKIRRAIQTTHINSKNIGLIANDDIDTYASIFAIWLEGYAYVPLHPQQPVERCFEIISQAEIELVINSCNNNFITGKQNILTAHLEFDDFLLQPKKVSDDSLAYILFTSGSTGKPKGVQITRKNLAEFVNAFWNLGYDINEKDKFLQPFDLTFDLSVMSYLIPLIKGAGVYTIPHDQIKYSFAEQLLEDHSLTVALMVPSTIRYLRPYFKEIHLEKLRYSLFCGEALPLDLVEEWSNCVPNAQIDNVYGPTENTIFCSSFSYNCNSNKSYNGVLSIGRSMSSGEMIIVDERNIEVPEGEQGELCLSGGQLTPGYWKNDEKNKEAFFIDAHDRKFYKTGDICFKDNEGDIMYCGRKDHQVKVQGFRIELGEIEFHSSIFLKGINTIACAFENRTGNTEIALFVESESTDTGMLIEYLKSKIPYYMVPTKLFLKSEFPLNSNEKVDRKRLQALIPI